MPTGGKEAFLSKVTFRRESNWVSKTKQMLKDTKTIEERAEAIYKGNTIEEDAYKRGATEQKAIDIDKACEWLCEHIDDYARIGEDGAWVEHSVVRDFRKAMEGTK